MIGRILAIIRKELALLSRSKSSTIAMLTGPLLVILLVGLVFTNAGDAELVVGTIAGQEEFSAFTQALDATSITVEYPDVESCTEAVRRSSIAACVSFAAGTPPRATVIVDPSDVNAVYAVVEQVTGQLDEQSSRVRQSLTEELLGAVSESAEDLAVEQDRLRDSVFSLEQQRDKAQELAGNLGQVELDVAIVTPQDVSAAIDASINARDDYQLIAHQVLDDYRSFVRLQASGDNPYEGRLADIDEIEDRLAEIEDQTGSEAEMIFAELLSSLRDLDNEIAESRTQAQAMTSQASQLRSSLLRITSDVSQSQETITQTYALLSSIGISSGDITTPIDTEIRPVVAEQDALAFVFPYFLILIVMFTAILLASSVIVRERESAAYFRNFVTATPEWVFVVATFLTTMLVLLVQVVLIVLAGALVINLPLLASIGPLLVILLLATAFFTLVGMAVGYGVKTREGVMLAGIAIAAILLFVSGFVFPVQTLPSAVQVVVAYNPFVLSAEMVKASLLFSFGLGDILAYLIALLLYCVVLFVLIMIIQRVARIRFFERSDASERITEFLGQESVTETQALQLGKHAIGSLQELLAVLERLDDDEYEQYCAHGDNVISTWVRDVYKNDRLADELHNKSRLGAIALLKKNVR